MRSLLFVPGNDRRKLERALEAAADALILDLENSVPAASKAEARATVRGFLEQNRAGPRRPKLFVRVNSLGNGLTDDDLDAVMPGAPDAIVLPKAASGRDVQHLASLLAAHEARAGLDDGSTGIMAITAATAASIFRMATFEGSDPRLRGLAWAGEELAAAVEAESARTAEGNLAEPFALARSLALFASRAAGVPAIDTVFPAFRDLEGLTRECEQARRDGFVGKLAIHPAQVPVINDGFAPSAEAVAEARTIVRAFEADTRSGVVGLDGRMIDLAHLKRAKALLKRAE